MIFLYCERLVEFLLYIAYFINPVILINKSINECTCREIMGERRVESIFCMYIGEINNNPMRSSCHLIITCFRDLERLLDHLIVYGFSRFLDYDKDQKADSTGQQRLFTPQWHLIIYTYNVVEILVCSPLYCILSFYIWFWTLFVITTFRVRNHRKGNLWWLSNRSMRWQSPNKKLDPRWKQIKKE